MFAGRDEVEVPQRGVANRPVPRDRIYSTPAV